MTVEVRCPHCDRATDVGELRARPGAKVADPPGEDDPGYISGRLLYATESGIRLRGDRES